MSSPNSPERRAAARKTLTPQKFTPVDTKLGKHMDPADAPKPKTGGQDYTGLLIVAVVGVFFMAYIFNWAGFEAMVDGFFGGMYHKSQGKSVSMQTHFMNVLPFILVGIAALALYMVMAAIMRTFGPGKGSKGPAVRRPMTLHKFVPAAESLGIQVEIARETYKLLKPVCHHEKMPADLSDGLAEELGLTEAEIADVYNKLFLHTAHRANKRTIDPEMKSVSAMMLSVQEGAFGIALAAATPEPGAKVVGAVWVQPRKYPKEIADAQVAYHL
jgi:hypothetical protein